MQATMRAARAIWRALLLLPLVACGSDGIADVKTQPDAAQARARWGALGLNRYTVEMKLGCFCVPSVTSWHELRVEGNRVVAARMLEPPYTPRTAAEAALFPTVSALFDRIAEEQERPDGYLEGKYDVLTGLPVQVVVGTLANDAGIAYELRRLRPLPPL